MSSSEDHASSPWTEPIDYCQKAFDVCKLKIQEAHESEFQSLNVSRKPIVRFKADIFLQSYAMTLEMLNMNGIIAEIISTNVFADHILREPAMHTHPLQATY